MTYQIIKHKFHYLQVINEKGEDCCGLFDRFEYPQLTRLVTLLNKKETQLKPIQEICDKYKIPLEDLPDVLEEYIAYDNAEYLEKLQNQ